MVKIRYLESFRAIAILSIVAGHCFGSWKIDTLPEKVVANIIVGGTSLFVFLSGFFLHHVFASRFEYVSFLRKKAIGVFVPYVFLASAAFFIIVVVFNRPHSALMPESKDFADYALLYFRYLATGRAMTGYWYIPFIALVFLLTPVFLEYMKFTREQQIALLLLLSLVAMVTHRPSQNLDPVHSLVYFTPVYLMGITVSMNFASVMSFVRRYTVLLGLIFFASVVLTVVVHGYGNYSKATMLSWQGPDLMFVSKIVLIFFLLSLLSRVHDKCELGPLRFVADHSFPLFFLHTWFLLFPMPTIKQFLPTLPGGLMFLLTFAVTTSCCLAFAFVMGRLLGKKSHYFIG